MHFIYHTHHQASMGFLLQTTTHVNGRESMINLIIFIFATCVGLFLYHVYRPKSDREVEEERATASMKKKTHRFHNSSLFYTLGMSVDEVSSFRAFSDHFTTMSAVSESMKRAGLEECHVVVGVDFTASNEWQGRRSFTHQNLHTVQGNKTFNPYQKVISTLGQVLDPFISRPGQKLWGYGFGDLRTQDHSVFPFTSDDKPCTSFTHLLQRYTLFAREVTLSGPTSFAPLIYKTLEHVQLTNHYHILVIVADGQMREEEHTVQAIVDASDYPLSIIMVGVGDGPWEVMEEFDDWLPRRKFDNFQFVNYQNVTAGQGRGRNPEMTLALHCLMEIPDQFKAMQKLEYL